MRTINGQEMAQEMLTKLQSEVRKLLFQPLFCDILIGDDPVATAFVKIKLRRADEVGYKPRLIQLPVTATTEAVIEEIRKIQRDPFLSGLIIQFPLPPNLDKTAILNTIDSRVDVDCLKNVKTRLKSPTAAAVAAILDQLLIDLTTKKILVIGQGELVGLPVTNLLKERGLNVITADGTTTNLSELTIGADIIISATGSPKLIKVGVILIDCGTSESAGSIVGDVDVESVESKVEILAPVHGGVGPITVAMLLQNVLEVAKDLE